TVSAGSQWLMDAPPNATTVRSTDSRLILDSLSQNHTAKLFLSVSWNTPAACAAAAVTNVVPLAPSGLMLFHTLTLADTSDRGGPPSPLPSMLDWPVANTLIVIRVPHIGR